MLRAQGPPFRPGAPPEGKGADSAKVSGKRRTRQGSEGTKEKCFTSPSLRRRAAERPGLRTQSRPLTARAPALSPFSGHRRGSCGKSPWTHGTRGGQAFTAALPQRPEETPDPEVWSQEPRCGPGGAGTISSFPPRDAETGRDEVGGGSQLTLASGRDLSWGWGQASTCAFRAALLASHNMELFPSMNSKSKSQKQRHREREENQAVMQLHLTGGRVGGATAPTSSTALRSSGSRRLTHVPGPDCTAPAQPSGQQLPASA